MPELAASDERRRAGGGAVSASGLVWRAAGSGLPHIHEELTESWLLQLWVEYAENSPGAYGQPLLRAVRSGKKKLNPTMRQTASSGREDIRRFFGEEAHIVEKTGELVAMELFVAPSSYYVRPIAGIVGEGPFGLLRWQYRWVPDNLKSGVDLADRYEPATGRWRRTTVRLWFRLGCTSRSEGPVQVAQRWILVSHVSGGTERSHLRSWRS